MGGADRKIATMLARHKIHHIRENSKRSAAAALQAQIDQLAVRQAQQLVMQAQQALSMGQNAANQIQYQKAQQVWKECTRFLSTEWSRWRDACDDTISACIAAELNYNMVLSAVPKPSIIEGVFKGVIIGLSAVQPEFAMLAVVIEMGANGKDDEEKMNKDQIAARDKINTKIETFKVMFKEAYEKGKEAYDKGEAEDGTVSAQSAQSQFMQKKLDGCSEFMRRCTTCRDVFQQTQDGADPAHAEAIFKAVQGTWRSMFPRSINYGHHVVSNLALILLYDMLRIYCMENVQVCLATPFGGMQPISQSKARDLISSDSRLASAVDFKGLNTAQREKMYEQFEALKNLPPMRSRPMIANYKDLIMNWSFRNGA